MEGVSSQVSALLAACEQGAMGTVQSLLDAGVHVDSANEEGGTALQVCGY